MKRFAVAAVVLLLLAVAAGGVWYWRASREHATVRGSPTVEFTPTQEPATQKRPAKVVANTPWPMYGYSPARTRVASQFDVRPPFRPVWSRRLWAIVEFPPVVAYNAVYVTQARGWVFKFQAETGRALWRKHFHRCSAASPAAGHQVLFVALMQRYPCNRYPRTQSGEVVAVRVRGGKILWRFKNVGVVESSPLLVKKTLYFGSWDHKLYALAVGGKRPVVKWTFTADNELNSSPAYAAGKIFVGSDSGSIYAIDAKTGKLVWHATSFSHFPRGREYFYATPAVAYGRVFAPNTDGWVYAYGAATGRLLWARHVGTYAYTAPAVWNKRVYVGTYDGYALALDAATGDVRWRYAAPAALHGAPSIVDGLVYFATCERCGQNGSRSAKAGPRETFALDARTGRLVWHIPDGQYSPVVADAGHVFVVGRGRIYAFEPRHAKHHAKTRAKKKKVRARGR